MITLRPACSFQRLLADRRCDALLDPSVLPKRWKDGAGRTPRFQATFVAIRRTDNRPYPRLDRMLKADTTKS